MTFAQSSFGRTVSRTSLFLKRQLWIWPVVAMLVLSVLGYGIRRSIQHTMENSLRSELQTLVDIERSMVEKWLKIQESNAETVANDQQVRRIILDILAAQGQAESAAAEGPDPAVQPQLADLFARLSRELEPAMTAHKFVGYVVADKSQQVVAAYTRDLIGTTVPQYEDFLVRALEGTPTVSPPFPSEVMLKDGSGRLRSGTPTLFVAAPVRDENLQVVAVLALRARPEEEFTNILQLGRTGQTGETYAIDQHGLLVSNSRFDEELIRLGVLPDVENSRSILTLLARDPGGDMTAGYRPSMRRSEMPPTRSAAAAVAGESGVDVAGYRGYRGAKVVGAWSWLPKYNLGIITEFDYGEAFRPLTILRRAFLALFALLTISAVAIFAFTLVVARLQREAQKAAIEARQLGQYHLEHKLGAGAMGVVYKGHHAMLRRPTAIKMLNVDRVNEASIQRFEREVQITCKLNNPHTVAIYDYGRTPEGVFYYAMEYLDGIDLQGLVDRYGAQPEGRVISILQQICQSLYEAHLLGLVHRDIKPANVMLNRRGGACDVVKVLDFGLVRALDEDRQNRQSGGLTGTPLYMSPEAIQDPDIVDARSDLYAVGAVGYFLLTGSPVFQADSLVKLCQQHLTSLPEPPSQRLGQSVSAELESALLACLEKNRAKRPQTARDLMNLLDRAPTSKSWRAEDADAWWGRHERAVASTAATGFAPAGSVSSSAPPVAASAVTPPAVPPAVPPAKPAGGSEGKSAASGFDQTMDSRGR